ncbi:hypothetical protein [Microbulbifer sp. TRSA007]
MGTIQVITQGFESRLCLTRYSAESQIDKQAVIRLIKINMLICKEVDMRAYTYIASALALAISTHAVANTTIVNQNGTGNTATANQADPTTSGNFSIFTQTGDNNSSTTSQITNSTNSVINSTQIGDNNTV